MPIYQQIPIRLEASLVSNPPVAPIDANTGTAPRFWRAQDIAVSVGVFNAYGVSVDLSNVAHLNLQVQLAPDSPVPLIYQTIDAVNIVPTITRAGWTNGMQQQAKFILTAEMTDLGLGGANSMQFWMLLSGVTVDNQRIVYSSGYITFFNPGNTLAIPPYGYVSRNAQTTTSGNATISPKSLNHTEILTVNGVSRVSNIILSVVGMDDGAVLRLRLLLPATDAITLNVLNADLSGAQLSTVGTGSVLNALFTYVFNGQIATWEPVGYALPST